jgi:hypothetical protein
MLDLPDHGYVDYQLTAIDPGGTTEPIFAGEATTIDRPGYRYAITYLLPALPMTEARIFQSLLERGAREDVSYPWPLDFRPPIAGAPLVSAASPAGATIPVKGLTANYQFRQGQPFAVVSEGRGFIHKVTAVTSANASGNATLSVFPVTRKAFLLNDVIEVEKPRIRGVLTWQGAQQPAHGARPFTFTITER